MIRDKELILYSTPIERFTNKGIFLIAVLYFGSLVFAAILSPLFFQLVHALDPDTSSYLANKPFPDYFERARLLFVVILLPILFVKCGLTTKTAIGFKKPGFKVFATWVLYGIGMMTAIYGLYFILDTIAPKENWTISRQIEKFAVAAFGAFVIALIEESFFRGLVFRAFYSAVRPRFAILLSSMFFAMLHFKMGDEPLSSLSPEKIGIDDGFHGAWLTLTAFTDGFNALQFINLTLVGILLHQSFMITKNLWSCIGMHMGWVFIILGLSKTFNETPNANHFTGTERVLDGYWVGVVMLLFIFVFAAKQRKISQKHPLSA
ncbi:CPBP family intramembrane metalloprotease [Puniceicoccaceae bacterium K14]|nr:CPBP family intramembrane metalloprotease [Puniceicoccaceae bacterium K14]